MNIAAVERALAEHAGIHVQGKPRPVGGASCGPTLRLASDAGPLFLKLADGDRAWALAAEAAGLEALALAGELAVPRVRAQGQADDSAYLALDWIELEAPPRTAHAALGRALARQHRHGASTFGWERDTSLGATRQPNAPHESWAVFFAERRLGYQLGLACDNGLPAGLERRLETLLSGLDGLLGAHRPSPALLHGDLWSGNWGVDASGRIFVFDPSVYYGDREADLAIARLFGGFAPEFYAAYRDESPLPAGWERRGKLYELYHLLNHFNLFGTGYLPGVEACLDTLAAEG